MMGLCGRRRARAASWLQGQDHESRACKLVTAVRLRLSGAGGMYLSMYVSIVISGDRRVRVVMRVVVVPRSCSSLMMTRCCNRTSRLFPGRGVTFPLGRRLNLVQQLHRRQDFQPVGLHHAAVHHHLVQNVVRLPGFRVKGGAAGALGTAARRPAPGREVG